MSQTQREPDMPIPDSSNTFVLVEDEEGQPLEPLHREQLERLRKHWRENTLDNRCTVKPEILKKMRIAAERLGIGEGDLICEGFDLLLHKHREKLGDLLAQEQPSDAPKPEHGTPSP